MCIIIVCIKQCNVKNKLEILVLLYANQKIGVQIKICMIMKMTTCILSANKVPSIIRVIVMVFALLSDHVPFKEFLVYPDPDYMQPAEYINDIKSPPDWDIIFDRESLLPRKEESSDYSLLNDFERIRLNSSCKSKLDETQLLAVELALKNKLVLIQVIYYMASVCMPYNTRSDWLIVTEL